jgi:hypothetical protein
MPAERKGAGEFRLHRPTTIHQPLFEPFTLNDNFVKRSREKPSKHVAYVDLSAKAEHWATDSAVAVSNGIRGVYLVPAKVKQNAKRLLTELYGSKSITYRVFALLVYLALREHLPVTRQLIIDKDYTGANVEGTIRNLLLHYLQRDGYAVEAGFFRFAHIKDSRADLLARQVFMREARPTREISWAEVEAVILGK